MEEASSDHFNQLLGTATMEFGLKVSFESIKIKDN